MKNIRIKVRESCDEDWYDFGIFEGRKMLMLISGTWKTKKAAIRNAKAMAKHIGIEFDPEIVKQRGW